MDTAYKTQNHTEQTYFNTFKTILVKIDSIFRKTLLISQKFGKKLLINF